MIINKLAEFFTREDRLIAAAIVRLGLGTVLLSLYILHYDFRHFIWGPDAFVPWDMFAREIRESGSYSIYSLTRSNLAFELLFHTGLVVTALWTVGVKSRISGVLTYVFAFSLWERNGYILDGGENILIICLFFLMFARTDRYLAFGSAERRRRVVPVLTAGETWRMRASAGSHILGTILHNAALAAIVLQLCFMYLTSALFKVQGDMWQNGVALYYILRVQEFTLPGVAPLVYQNAVLVTLFTYVTVLEQLAYPFMLLNRYTKRFSVVLVIQMHIGIAILMGLVSFSSVMITLQAAAFRDVEIEQLLKWVLRRVVGGARTVSSIGMRLRRLTSPAPRPAAWVRNAFAVEVFYDDWCPRCRLICKRAHRLDWFGLINFVPVRSGAATVLPGIAADRILERLHVRYLHSGRVCSGARAMAAMAARAPGLWPLWPPLLIGSVLGIGERIYDAVARRRVIIPVDTCAEADCVVGPMNPLR